MPESQALVWQRGRWYGVGAGEGLARKAGLRLGAMLVVLLCNRKSEVAFHAEGALQIAMAPRQTKRTPKV